MSNQFLEKEEQIIRMLKTVYDSNGAQLPCGRLHRRRYSR